MKGLLKTVANRAGYDVVKLPKPRQVVTEVDEALTDRKIHYACGHNFMEGWLNVDYFDQTGRPETWTVNLVEKHPFASDFFEWGFCEDFLEHISQPDSIIFLAEIYRTFKPGGVCRFSFPGWDNQAQYFPPAYDYETAKALVDEHYTQHFHLHFYAHDEFEQVCKHIGFSKVEFVHYGESEHTELCNLDTRLGQKTSNTQVEITK